MAQLPQDAQLPAPPESEIVALAAKNPDTPSWREDERAILTLCDDLHATSRLSAVTWSKLNAAFDEAQILELIALAGFYRTVAYYCNGLELPLESYGAPLPNS